MYGEQLISKLAYDIHPITSNRNIACVLDYKPALDKGPCTIIAVYNYERIFMIMYSKCFCFCFFVWCPCMAFNVSVQHNVTVGSSLVLLCC